MKICPGCFKSFQPKGYALHIRHTKNEQCQEVAAALHQVANEDAMDVDSPDDSPPTPFEGDYFGNYDGPVEFGMQENIPDSQKFPQMPEEDELGDGYDEEIGGDGLEDLDENDWEEVTRLPPASEGWLSSPLDHVSTDTEVQ